MKNNDAKKAFMEKARAEYLSRTVEEQLKICKSRPGESKREVEKLQKLAKDHGKKKTLGEILNAPKVQ